MSRPGKRRDQRPASKLGSPSLQSASSESGRCPDAPAWRKTSNQRPASKPGSPSLQSASSESGRCPDAPAWRKTLPTSSQQTGLPLSTIGLFWSLPRCPGLAQDVEPTSSQLHVPGPTRLSSASSGRCSRARFSRARSSPSVALQGPSPTVLCQQINTIQREYGVSLAKTQ